MYRADVHTKEKVPRVQKEGFAVVRMPTRSSGNTRCGTHNTLAHISPSWTRSGYSVICPFEGRSSQPGPSITFGADLSSTSKPLNTVGLITPLSSIKKLTIANDGNSRSRWIYHRRGPKRNIQPFGLMPVWPWGCHYQVHPGSDRRRTG